MNTSNIYAKAYKEVLEIIKYFPKEEFNKIPKEKTEFFKQNMDQNYKFSINPQIDLSKQNISKEANAIIVNLYQDYFATEEEKAKINKILELNELKAEQEKRKKYNIEDIFKNKRFEKIEEETVENTESITLVENKETFFKKFKKFIFKLLHISKE